jgi:hypothetical protein
VAVERGTLPIGPVFESGLDVIGRVELADLDRDLPVRLRSRSGSLLVDQVRAFFRPLWRNL